MPRDRIAGFATLGLLAFASLSIAQDKPTPTGPERWESEIRAFEEADRAEPPEPGAVLFLGSSSIRLWETLAEDFPGVRVLNRGFGGSETADATAFVDRIVTPYRPDAIVFYEGDNDLANGKSPEQVAADFSAFVDRVRADLPDVPIGYIAIKPSPARLNLLEAGRAANEAIEAYAEDHEGITFIDVVRPMLDTDGQPRGELFRDDRLHLNAEGYTLWRRVVGRGLGRMLSQGGRRYELGPDSLPKAGVPEGEVKGPFEFRSKVLEGTVRKYWVYVPRQYDPSSPANLLVFQDGQRAINPKGVLRVPTVLDNLIADGSIPPTIGLFITPGQRGETYPDSIGLGNPDNRSVEYDSLGDAYARFLVDELLPEIEETYNVSDDPDRRAIGGASSGAICAFNVAWERPEAFGNVISFIGSYTNIRGGQIVPDLVLESEPKPIRVFLQDGTHDLRNPADPDRDWHLQNLEMIAALKAKGYDLKVALGEGGHSDDHGGMVLPDALRWLGGGSSAGREDGDGDRRDQEG